MAHNGEELFLGLLALFRGGQGALQQADLLLLLLLLFFHVPETEHRLVGDALRVCKEADADPALLTAKLTEKLTAEVPDLLVYLLFDVLQGEAVGKFLSGPIVQAGGDNPQQIIVVAGLLAQLLDGKVGAFGYLIDAGIHIDAVYGIVHVAKYLHRLGGPLRRPAEPAVPQPHKSGYNQK